MAAAFLSVNELCKQVEHGFSGSLSHDRSLWHKKGRDSIVGRNRLPQVTNTNTLANCPWNHSVISGYKTVLPQVLGHQKYCVYRLSSYGADYPISWPIPNIVFQYVLLESWSGAMAWKPILRVGDNGMKANLEGLAVGVNGMEANSLCLTEFESSHLCEMASVGPFLWLLSFLARDLSFLGSWIGPFLGSFDYFNLQSGGGTKEDQFSVRELMESLLFNTQYSILGGFCTSVFPGSQLSLDRDQRSVCWNELRIPIPWSSFYFLLACLRPTTMILTILITHWGTTPRIDPFTASIRFSEFWLAANHKINAKVHPDARIFSSLHQTVVITNQD